MWGGGKRAKKPIAGILQGVGKLEKSQWFNEILRDEQIIICVLWLVT